MNFDRSLIFSYLEEDNIQRAYFRVRPLLTLDGDIRQEAIQLWPNEGGLRIVPDRNEQHTFKVRMRTLGSYCVVDLRDQPPEAGKIRTNKNFRPDRGEVNQYILYSDTVHELPENTFYQLLDGAVDDYAALAESAITPLFYIRQNDTLYGPVRKSAAAQPETAQEAAGVLFELPCPDGVTRMMLCFDDAPAKDAAKNESVPAAAPAPAKEEKQVPAAAEQTVPEPIHLEASDTARESKDSLPIGETLHILEPARNHEDTLKQLNKPVSSGANLLRQQAAPESLPVHESKSASLTGTPLIRTPLHVSVQQTKNHTQEVVSSQWSVGKYESPAQNLPAGTKLRSVQNPVEAACLHLREAWNASGSHDYLTDFILSLDGIRGQLEAKMCTGSSGTIMQRVLRQRLQDLEAERLSALCELDRAQRDVDAYKQELLNGLAARISRETGKLAADKNAAANQLATLKDEVNAMILQRDTLAAKVDELQKATLPEAVAKLVADAQMTAPVSGIPLRINPVSGQDADLGELVDRVMNACGSSGVAINRNYAIAIIVLFAISPRIGLSCQTPAAAATLLKNIAACMGWSSSYAHQYAAEQQPLVGIRPVDSTPAVFTTSLPNYAPISGVTKLTLSRNTSNLIRNAAYDVSQWPVLMLPALPFIPEIEGAEVAPVSAASIAKAAAASAVTNAELDAVLSPVLKAAMPLSGAAKKEMYRFVSVCANLMEGGLPAAADWAILLWIIPAIEHGSKSYASVKPLLDEYPLSLAKL